MKQPELGNKVLEIRNSRGLTQKELSESCNVDIRTIQRIESGEVIPRWSTLRIIAAALECGENLFIDDSYIDSQSQKQILLFSFIMGLLYFMNFLVYGRIIDLDFLFSADYPYLLLSIIHMIAGVLFFYGFYAIGNYKRSRILQIASFLIMIILPLFVISDIILNSSTYTFTVHIRRLLLIQLAIAGIIFGIGLLNIKSKYDLIYKITGVLQVLTAVMILIQVPLIQYISLWLSIPYILLLLSIVYLEYRASFKQSIA